MLKKPLLPCRVQDTDFTKTTSDCLYFCCAVQYVMTYNVWPLNACNLMFWTSLGISLETKHVNYSAKCVVFAEQCAALPLLEEKASNLRSSLRDTLFARVCARDAVNTHSSGETN